MIVSSIVQATVSVNRLADFLASSELQPDAVKVEEVSLAPGDIVGPTEVSVFGLHLNG